MKEDFLHYIWQHKKFNCNNLITTDNKDVVVKSVGQLNTNAGPDFFNSQIEIDNQLWAGNVEIHVKSSDWYVHNHQNDANYNNVILHVVWEDDVDVFRDNNTKIPTLELKHYIDGATLNNYNTLFLNKKQTINCENDFAKVDSFVLNNWLERLFFERLERKSLEIAKLLKASNNNWEAVLFKMLCKNFGLKVNSDAFLSLANATDFSTIRKASSNINQLEAILFGQANMLDVDIEDDYSLQLKSEYAYQKQKYKLTNDTVLPFNFFRLRPAGFPTIRISQLANLYHLHQNLFSKVTETSKADDFYKLFNVSTTDYWKTHYTFGKLSSSRVKKLSKSFIDLVLINTIIPLKFSYSKYTGNDNNEEFLELMRVVSSEKNTIINTFNSIKKVSYSALDSQALIQLKTEYCDKQKCLQCAIGGYLLNR